jgi:hypothetical protein
MNRRAFEAHLRSRGCILHHHGRRHDVWLNPGNMALAPVPRHREIKRGTARDICRVLGVPRPRGL